MSTRQTAMAPLTEKGQDPRIVFVTSRPNGELISAEYLDLPGASADDLLAEAFFEFLEATLMLGTPPNNSGAYSTKGGKYLHTADGRGEEAVLEVIAVAPKNGGRGDHIIAAT